MEPENNTENAIAETKKSSFTSLVRQLTVCDEKFTLRILKMNESTLLFISKTTPEYLDELGVGMYKDDRVIGTTILGTDVTTSNSQRLAEKLSKRFRRPVFVSYNISLDLISGPLLERELSEYLRSHETEVA